MTTTTTQTPYAGVGDDGTQTPTATHLLVTGPSSSEGLMRVLAPGALLWHGPRVLVSTKPHLAAETIARGLSDRGATLILGMTGEIDPDTPWLQGVDAQRVRADPTALITDDDSALAMAHRLIRTVPTGPHAALWASQAAAPLAALLLAGRIGGGGIAWSTRAVGRPEDADGGPGWPAAIDLTSGVSRHAAALEDLMGMDRLIQDEVTMIMRAALSAFVRDSVVGDASATPVTTSMLEDPGEPTLHVIAPADGSAAGAVVAVVETIIQHWRGAGHDFPRLLLTLDDVATAAPLPHLASYLADSDLGVSIVASVQSTHQLALAWGEATAEVIRDNFPAVAILGTPPERELLEAAAARSGETDAISLLPRSAEEARLLIRGQAGPLVRIPGIWDWKD